MADGYVSSIRENGLLNAGDTAFVLNQSDTDLEAFRLQQDMILLTLTHKRLDEGRVEKHVLGPLKRALEISLVGMKQAEVVLKAVKDEFSASYALKADVASAEKSVIERSVVLNKAKIELNAKTRQVLAQRTRMNKNLASLKELIRLNIQKAEMSRFLMPWSGNISCRTFAGAFVEAGDVICTITPGA